MSDYTNDRITLAHGGGGRLSRTLVEDVFLPVLGNDCLNRLNDSAVLNLPDKRIAFTTDSFVVDPLFFPGGDIGRLAVCGTVNDLAVMGAVPRYLSLGLIIEEGFELESLRSIIQSIKDAADEAGVTIVTGDTKVVARGQADGLYINTSGIGSIERDLPVHKGRVRSGDLLIVNAPLGQHGMAVITSREELGFKTTIKSDVAPLNGLIDEMLRVSENISAMRDATRGGLAGVLNEMADQGDVQIILDEIAIPVNEDVHIACDMLGFEAIHVANEGVLLAAVPPDEADRMISTMRLHPYGRHAAVIGEVGDKGRARVTMRTHIGTHRVIDVLSGEQLPRIC
ncbi:hydrogenase expression/formation protein HypE [bacterium]|nr:hydrogenase expression/formation protein HypE [bacterium]